MDFVQHKVLQDVAQCKVVLQRMEAELQSLPAGFLTHRTVRGRCSYYIETRKPKTSKSIPKEQVEETKVIFQRKKFLKENINQISYEYEKPLLLKGLKKPIHPDFTIYTPHKHNVV